MHAIRHHSFGPPDVLVLERVPDPDPGAGRLRIAVEAAGVHLIDTSIRAGEAFGAGPQPHLPAVPGREVAGVVDRVGPGVDGSWLGTRVVAHLGMGGGGYAELAVVDAARAYEIPAGLDAPTAVAAIGTGRTAAAILALARIERGETVAVTSAAGGLGVLLIQGARNAGAAPVGLAGGPDKVALVARLAAPGVDYRAAGWADLVAAHGPLDVVLDGVGGAVGRALYAGLAPGGRLVRYGCSSGEPNEYDDPARPVVDVLGPPIMSRLAEFEEDALAAATDGSRVPYVGTSFPLAEAARAHRALESRASVGKVVLAVRQ